MTAKINCVPDPESDFPVHFPGEVEVHLSDGRTFSRRVVSSHGTPGDPMSLTEVREKFDSTAGRVMSKEQVSRVADLVERLDQLDDVSELIDACTI